MELEYFLLRIEPVGRQTKSRSGGPQISGQLLSNWKSAIAAGIPAQMLNVDLGPKATAKIIAEPVVLSETQAIKETKDPANLLAPVMPITLLQPCASADYGIASDPDPVVLATTSKASWGIGGVAADKSPYTGANVRVAVLDTGIAQDHPAFAGITKIKRNFTNEGGPKDVTDRNGHGTHCAGTIFGRDTDGVRIGVARGVTTAIIGKVLDENGFGSTKGILSALQWAREQKADVISISIGLDFPGMQEKLVEHGLPPKIATSMALKSYRENLRLFETLLAFLAQEGDDRSGAVFVAAAGNESLRDRKPPFVIDASLPAASSPNIISVGATMQDEGKLRIAPFSNVNPVLCAPGVNIVSANYSGGLTAMNGTSMACPHVAGLAALWWEAVAKEGSKPTGALVRAKVVGAALPLGFHRSVKPEDRGAGWALAPHPDDLAVDKRHVF